MEQSERIHKFVVAEICCWHTHVLPKMWVLGFELGKDGRGEGDELQIK